MHLRDKVGRALGRAPPSPTCKANREVEQILGFLVENTEATVFEVAVINRVLSPVILLCFWK